MLNIEKGGSLRETTVKRILIYSHFRDKLEPHALQIRIQGKRGLRHRLYGVKVPSEFHAWRWSSHEITSVLKSMRIQGDPPVNPAGSFKPRAPNSRGRLSSATTRE